MNTSLADLARYQQKTWHLKGISALLGWDAKTYMPTAGIAGRSQQLPLIEGLIHERITSADYRKLLEKLINLESGEIRDTSLSEREQRLLKESLRDYRLAMALPNEFVLEMAETASKAEHAWSEAREKNDYSIFRPYLEKIIGLCKKKAGYLALGATPYDSLLNAYEPGANTVDLNRVFDELKTETIQLISKLPEAKPVPAFLKAKYNEQKQLDIAHDLMKEMGAPEENIRLDLTAHPFCTTIHCRDVRITTRFDGIADCQLTILHETGHALYELGLPEEWYGTPLCEAVSMGIHESESRFWEVFIGKNRAFWQKQFPIMQAAFPRQLKNVTPDSFYDAINVLQPSMIRVRADELTYNLHIIIRYELEQAMINGTIDVGALPELWNDKYEKYLGIRPKNFSEGILQDIHWSFGDIGYFPTYTLGNLYAAHWWEQIQKDVPDVEGLIREHNFAPILKWHREKIHCHGRAKTGAELVKSITGSGLSPKPLIRFLREKVSQLK